MSIDLVSERIASILARIKRAAQSVGREESEVDLVIVSKKQSPAAMNLVAAHIEASGRRVVFGENYLQEYLAKREQVEWSQNVHLIAPLQSNKISKAVQLFSLIESVHSEKVLRLIEAECKKQGKKLPVFLQVNISQDPAKSGMSVVECQRIFTEIVPELEYVSVEGLMTITEYYENSEFARKDFSHLRVLSESLSLARKEKLALSMGMSADFEVAIQEGATHVRIGTALFGER